MLINLLGPVLYITTKHVTRTGKRVIRDMLIRFLFFTAIRIEVMVHWDMVPCLGGTYERFGGPY